MIDGRIAPIFERKPTDEKGQIAAQTGISSRLESIAAERRIVVQDYSRYAKMGDGFYFAASKLPENAGYETLAFGEGFFEMHFCLFGTLRLDGAWGSISLEGPRLLFWYHPAGHDDASSSHSNPGSDWRRRGGRIHNLWDGTTGQGRSTIAILHN